VAAFRAAVFAGRPFEQSLDLFDGAVAVTFRDLSMDEFEVVRAHLDAELRAGSTAPTPYTLAARHVDLCMGFGVAALRVGAKRAQFVAPADPFKEDPAVRVRAVGAAAGSGTVYQQVRLRYEQFLAVLGTLGARAGDASFYSATGSRGATPASPPPT
jgi:hypothetical protein